MTSLANSTILFNIFFVLVLFCRALQILHFFIELTVNLGVVCKLRKSKKK